ncbi:Cd(II)/Pb(II)-responsive transcriptional regulator [Microbulbifer sp. OS29]|uniref:Cd(II)/Pb(II)-responsive transcriptional regulator n=1 Tax=Microbulbifer okhotskensis TaxID=2926617 RepID=A0A9X2ER33_9GAMM|nr:Cd(II)/Pb(II)-responsive transcriptional regulator [Microbulbifer okhotskensis]MCO1336250.1 Cd(II)/Pb(II)-responsive transcriptional regulator [Microbulbifer okhotskensis]
MGYKIGEVARKVGCKVETIRFYEKAGLLPEPSRSAGNFRLYSDSHLEQLRLIRHCRSLDMSLDTIRNLLKLRLHAAENCREINDLVDAHICRVEAQMKLLTHLRGSLQKLRSQCSGPEASGTCEILLELSGCECHGAGVGS